jgi:uncharacterized membrane protein
MNNRQIEHIGLILKGVALGVAIGGTLSKNWIPLIAILFLLCGIWFWWMPPEFLKKLKLPEKLSKRFKMRS